MNKKGFTLLELLIVIAILAILATVTFVVLNPAQLLAQARDSQRISELVSLKSAINLYLATAASTTLQFAGGTCVLNCWVQPTGVTANCGGRHATTTKITVIDADRTVDGTGWVPVKLTDTSGGSPLAFLPIDPSSNVTYFYSYACDNINLTFELGANMESTAYGQGGTKDVESTDGGNLPSIYEVGTDPGLDL